MSVVDGTAPWKSGDCSFGGRGALAGKSGSCHLPLPPALPIPYPIPMSTHTPSTTSHLPLRRLSRSLRSVPRTRFTLLLRDPSVLSGTRFTHPLRGVCVLSATENSMPRPGRRTQAGPGFRWALKRGKSKLCRFLRGSSPVAVSSPSRQQPAGKTRKPNAMQFNGAPSPSGSVSRLDSVASASVVSGYPWTPSRHCRAVRKEKP